MNIIKIVAVAGIAFGLATCATAQANRQTYRDAMGRVTGTSTKDSSGKVTYRDAQGRVVGTKK